MKKCNKEKMIRKQILRAPAQYLLKRKKSHVPDQKLTFNINYYSAFQNARSIIEELHILVTPN